MYFTGATLHLCLCVVYVWLEFYLLTAPVKYITSVSVYGLHLVGVLLTATKCRPYTDTDVMYFTGVSGSKTTTKYRPYTDTDVMYFTGAVSK
jgi:hypothetical protein